METNKVDSFYSPEIILDYLVDEKNSVINIYSSSDSVYRIRFGTNSYWMCQAVDFMQGKEEYSCKVK